jgi:FimV-like protein
MHTFGTLLVQKGEAERGVRLLQQALSISPNATAIRLNLAKALIAAGDRESARKELDELAKLGDKFPAQAEVVQLRAHL